MKFFGESGKLRVLSDYHHGGLFASTQIICDKLGYELYRPVGMEWFHQGFFGVAEPYANAIGTVEQFLEPSKLPVVNDAPACNYGSIRRDGVYCCRDFANEAYNYGISFEQFAQNEFDVIIASIPNHLEKFKRLRDIYQPHAKLIYQLGNPGWGLPSVSDFPNILDSVGMVRDEALRPYHYMRYHQPFNEEVFFPGKPTDSKDVSSFVLFPENHELFKAVASLLPEYQFVAYGYSPPCDRSQITGISNIAKIMRDSRFGWHYKTVDGYGHIIHNWAACGRPIIASYAAYEQRQAQNLLVHKQTGYNLDGSSPADVAAFIKEAESPEYYAYLVEQTYLRYKAYVDFDTETTQLQRFFETLR